jgi:hypothetical protein
MEYPTWGWVSFQSATLGQFCIGTNNFPLEELCPCRKSSTMTLKAEEFIRRFLLHTVPRGFVKIRHFGFLANRCRQENLLLCRKLLAASRGLVLHDSDSDEPKADRVDRCPRCKLGSMRMLEIKAGLSNS